MKIGSRNFPVLAMGLVLATGAWAAGPSYHQTVDGVDIHIGIVPAETVSAYPPEYPEAKMHGGAHVNEHHLTVAVFDARDGERVRNAAITAHVSGLRGVDVRRNLEPMLIAGMQTFGNYFPMTGPGPFRIELEIQVSGATLPVRAAFTWSPP